MFPALVTIWLFVRYASAHQLAVDFQHTFWVVGVRVRDGSSPYAWTRHQLLGLVGFPYPAFAALLFVPFSVLPRGVGEVTFVLMSMTACLTAMRLLDIRDWRVYAIVLLWWPVINAWQTGNLTLLLVLGVAAAWRYRDSPVRLGIVIAVIVSIKPIVWPLGIWMLATGRWRATAAGVVCGLALNAAAWAVIGFDQLGAWLHLIHRQSDLVYRQGYSLTALAVRAGVAHGTATVLQALVTLGLVIVCVALGRRAQDHSAFTLAVAVIIVASPRVDNHYFALLLVPLAVARPTLSRAWLLPLAFWLCPATDFATWQLACAWIVLAAMTVCLTRGAVGDAGIRDCVCPSPPPVTTGQR